MYKGMGPKTVDLNIVQPEVNGFDNMTNMPMTDPNIIRSEDGEFMPPQSDISGIDIIAEEGDFMMGAAPQKLGKVY